MLITLTSFMIIASSSSVKCKLKLRLSLSRNASGAIAAWSNARSPAGPAARGLWDEATQAILPRAVSLAVAAERLSYVSVLR